MTNPALNRALVPAWLLEAKTWVFDFDGTLVDSNAIKLDAFDACFAEFSEHRDQIQAYCRTEHHVPRWEKFRYVYEKILHLPLSEAMAAALSDRYAAATTDAVAKANEIVGAETLLRGAGASKEKSILSSTPQDVLESIIERRGWKPYFREIKGAPVSKTEWLKKQPTPALTVFFGDTKADLGSARTAGCRFVGVVNEELIAEADFWVAHFSTFNE
jgi:phosphoglycolate phosphatase-like HAD superfamily hydrolase